VGVADLAQIEVRGDTIEAAARPFVPYRVAALERFGAATIVEKNTCTGCMGEMISTFLYLTKAGYEDRLSDLALIMGMPEEIPPLDVTPVVVGKCARPHRDLGIYVPGCPPLGLKITEGACEALGIDKETIRRTVEELHDFSFDQKQ
jgi:hypothetical protein